MCHMFICFLLVPAQLCVNKPECIFTGSAHRVVFVCWIAVADTYCIWSYNMCYVLPKENIGVLRCLVYIILVCKIGKMLR